MKIFLVILIFFICGISQAQARTYHVVGTELPPLMYLKNENPRGFYVDLLSSMVSNLEDIHVRIHFYPAPRMFKILSENHDTFSLGITRNEKREHLYKWVGPIYPRIFALFKLKSRHDIKIKTIKDIHPYKVGVGRGYAAVNDLLKAGMPEKNLEKVTHDHQNISKFFAGRIDFVVMNDVMLAYLLNMSGHSWNEVEQVMILNDQYEFWYAFNRAFDDKIIAELQQSLDLIIRNGTYQNLVKQYFQ